MNNHLVIPAVLVLLLHCVEPSGAEARDAGDRAPAPASADGRPTRQYAPSREVDIKHLALEITPDFRRRTIEGSATLTFAPIARPLAELKLDGVDLEVRDVSSSEPVQAWQATENRIIITFATPPPPDREVTLSIRYSAAPRKGLYFRTAEMGYKAEDACLWTQGEPTESRHWFPSFDSPNEKFTSEITCRVPADMTVLSNGHLVSSETDGASGLKTVRWLQDKPHCNYLIALAAGHLKGLEDKYRDIPIALYTPASQLEYARNTFEGLKDMLAFFEHEIGVPYPWDKYYQVCATDYHWGGMENTSLTILNENTLYPDGFEQLRSSESLVAHELAHQWFGDYVTCKDWSHIWLNEGFASYYDVLYQGHHHGREKLLYEMYQSARGILAQTDDQIPMVRRTFSAPEEQFSFRSYPKGAWVLHMLRSQLGDDLFRRCIKTYLERHKFGNVETSDLSRVVEELSGRSFDAFFDQYVYHAQQPDLSISYEWQEREHIARVSVTQNQKVGDEVLLFTMPAKIRFRGKFGTLDRELLIRNKSEEFFFPLPQAPDAVRFDPELSILARVQFPLPTAMLHAQLADTTDVIGRLLAIEQLSKKPEPETIARLRQALNGDPFYGVRLEASKTLRRLNTPEAGEALRASLKQPDARVRRQVLIDAAGPYSEESLATALQILSSEKNPDILAAAMSAAGAYADPRVKPQILAFLDATNSFRAGLPAAAIEAIRQQDNATYVEPLLSALKARQPDWPTSVFTSGLTTLGWIGRNEEKRDPIRLHLTSLLNHPKDSVVLAAIGALRMLGDAQAIAPLERFNGLAQDNPIRKAADEAVIALRAGSKPSAEIASVRGEILTLQQQNRDLRKEVETLRKKLEATLAASEPATNPAAVPSSSSASSDTPKPDKPAAGKTAPPKPRGPIIRPR
jgi:aminopeptidase N